MGCRQGIPRLGSARPHRPTREPFFWKWGYGGGGNPVFWGCFVTPGDVLMQLWNFTVWVVSFLFLKHRPCFLSQNRRISAKEASFQRSLWCPQQSTGPWRLGHTPRTRLRGLPGLQAACTGQGRGQGPGQDAWPGGPPTRWRPSCPCGAWQLMPRAGTNGPFIYGERQSCIGLPQV